jgi:hypothetical protein
VLQDLPYGFVASLTGSYVERAPTGYELFSHLQHPGAGALRREAAGQAIGERVLALDRQVVAGKVRSTASLFPGDYLPVEGEDPFTYRLTRRFAPKSSTGR